MFGFQDVKNALQIFIWFGAFAYAHHFVEGVLAGCGDDFLGVSNPYYFSPVAVYVVAFELMTDGVYQPIS